jgi:valyl-tRNA synthetase
VKQGPAIIVAEWPQSNEKFVDTSAEESFGFVLELIHQIRRVRKDFDVQPGSKIALIMSIPEGNAEKKAIIENNINEILTMANIDKEKLSYDASNVPKHAARIVLQSVVAYLPLEGIIDMDAEIKRISTQIANNDRMIEKVEANVNRMVTKFGDNEMIRSEKEKLEGYKTQKQLLQEQLNILK